MKTRYVLIDHENVQPKDLTLLDGQPLKVLVFLGAKQARISTELATALQSRGSDGECIQINSKGRNALDFHIAFYLGDLAAKNPEASFRVISKDHGYDALLGHLRSKGIDAQRSATLAALLPPGDDKLGTVIAHLGRLGHARPRRTKTLANTINALFGKALSETETQALVAALEDRGVISVTDAKVTYGALPI
jgi:hypothetical protein